MPSVASLSPSECESPERASSKRGAASEAVALGLELVHESPERSAVAEAEAVHVERNAHQGADPRLAAGALDALLHAEQRRQQAATALHVPDTVELGHG
jgi:hypothetical protein